MAPKRFSASSASQFMACPGSANLELAIPGFVMPEVDDTKGARGKGTMLHEYFALVGQLKVSDLNKVVQALQYVVDLRSTRRFKVLIEETVTADWLDSKPTTTVDLVLYTQDELHIIDYKAGVIPVLPERNEQLMFYAACFSHLAPKAKEATLHVIQPWAPDGINSWVCSENDLEVFIQDAQAADRRITNVDLTLVPSDNCTFCPANPHSRGDKGRPLCPVMMNKLYPYVVDEEEILNG